MLDAKFIRENIDLVKEAVKNKNEKADIDEFLTLYNRRKEIVTESQVLKEKRNTVSEEIGKIRKSGGDASATIAEMRDVSKKISDMDDELRAVEQKQRDLLLWIPNVPHESVPVGPDESCNVDVRSWGDKPSFGFTPAPHWELGEKLGLFDLNRAAKIAG